MKHIFLLLFLLILCYSRSHSQDFVLDDYSQAKIFFEAGQFELADSLFTRYLKQTPSIDISREAAMLFLRNNDSCAFCRYLRTQV